MQHSRHVLDSKRQLRFFYEVRDYIGFNKPALEYRRCLESLGFKETRTPEDADFVILHGLITDIQYWYDHFPILKEKYVIGYCVWETNVLPEPHRRSMALVDEVWTPSSYSRDVLLQGHDRVFVIPHVVPEHDCPDIAIDRLKERLDYREDVFYYYSIGRFPDPRKNMAASFRILSRLVDSGRVHYVIKDHSVDAHLQHLAVTAPPGVQIIRDMVDEDTIAALHSLCHCFVSSHCAEGWGLGMTEAMAAGNVVVATGYSGNMDYMTPENSLPVGYQVGPMQAQADLSGEPWTHDMRWAFVNESEMGQALRYCRHNWSVLAPLRQAATESMRKYAPATIARQIDARLSDVFGRHRPNRARLRQA